MEHNLVWLELASDDVAASKEFYSQIFGWDMSDGGSSIMVKVGAEEDLGATIKENPGRGHIPSHWAPFIQVADVKAATERAKLLGATVLYDVHELPEAHGFASTVLDPAGAPLSLWQKKGED